MQHRSFSLLTMLMLVIVTARAEIDPTDRALTLAADLPAGALKERLQSCASGPFYPTAFSIAHRGAPLGYPEHSREGYIAAANMGAGVIECDVTFTKDLELVCRHSQCDLASSTNILQTELATTCQQPFTPAASAEPASARCCTSDITLAEFKTLCARPDITNTQATSVDEFLAPLRSPVIDQPSQCGTVMSHRDSIKLIQRLGAAFIPELKRPEVPMPFNGFSQQAYADKLLAEYRELGIPAEKIYPQSFSFDDVRHWIKKHPEFAQQTLWLVPRPRQITPPTLQELRSLRAQGLKIIAPPIHMLVWQNAQGRIVPTAFAKAARASGLKIITWTFEAAKATAAAYGNQPGLMLEALDVLAQDVRVSGVFSDWPGTVTYYANCMAD